MSERGFLTGDTALATLALWQSGYFDTCAIATLLHVREDAVYRTLHMARHQAARPSAGPGRSEPAGDSVRPEQ
jgi:hypothetical protein